VSAESLCEEITLGRLFIIIKSAENSGTIRKDLWMAKIFCTGHAGYLGSVLFPLLEKKGHEVSGLDNYLYSEIKDGKFKDDICSLTDMCRATKGKDVVVALAGIVGDPACGLDEEATRIINLEATKLLIDVCEVNKVKRLIFASSCSVYGASQDWITENSQTNPLSLYAITKLESERLLLNRCDKCEPIILRFGTLFGYSPRMRFDLVANIMTATAIIEKQIVVNGGEQWRPLVHVKDVAEIIANFIEFKDATKLNLIYNVVHSNYKISKLAEIIAEITGAKVIERKENKDIRNYKVIPNLPLRISLEKGIKELKEHFDKGEFKDYKDKKYYNYEILQTLRTEVR
jgi:nucleoside-diphosphate-sugar epimerase